MLEAVVAAKPKVDRAGLRQDPRLHQSSSGATKAITTSRLRRSSCRTFTAEELKHALEQAGRGDLIPKKRTRCSNRSSIADFEPLITAKSPAGGKDIMQSSANNFYLGVTLADLKGFTEHYRLNSRVVKENGKLMEQVYRAGTPDWHIPPGLYAEYLTKSQRHADQGDAPMPSPQQAKVIADLIRYYQTGEYKDWIQFDTDWVQNNEPVDFANGFIEIYRDARGAKGTSQSFVSITDRKLSDAILQNRRQRAVFRRPRALGLAL